MTENAFPPEPEKLREMIRGIRYVMLGTVSRDGRLRSRPMTAQEKEYDGELWFFASQASEITREIEADARVSLAYTDPRGFRYISISGRGRVVRDHRLARQFWNPTLEAYFPLGVDDPQLVLLGVTPHAVEYWSTPPGALARFVALSEPAMH